MAEDQGSDDAVSLPPLVAPEGDTQVVRSGGRLRWMGAFVGVIAVIAGVLVVLGRGDDIDADEALAQAQAFVEDAESYRFELLESRRVTTGDPDGAGSDTTTRYLTTGDVADADHWHIVASDGDPEYDSETIRDGDTGYTSGYAAMFGGGDDEEVDVPDWSSGPIEGEPTVTEIAEMYAAYPELDDPESEDYDPQYAAEQRLDLAMVGYLLPVGENPEHVKRLVTEATDPAVEERLADGGVRLRARLAPVAEVVEASDAPIPPVDLVLDLDEERRPLVARFTAVVEGASQDVEVRYLGWGEPVTIAPPPDDDIDHTPWIPEEILAAHPELLVAPTALPEGWALVDAHSYASSYPTGGFGGDFEDIGEIEEIEEIECRTLDLTYATNEEMAFDHEHASEAELEAFYDTLDVLTVSVATADCVEADASIVSGGFFGEEEPSTREVRFEDLVVLISSTLDAAEVDLIEGSLQRVTVEQLAGMFPPQVHEQEMPYFMGGPFG